MLPVEITIIYSDKHLQKLAYELGRQIKTDHILPIEEALSSKFDGAIVFLVDHKSDLSKIWQLVATGITTIPILFVINDKFWVPCKIEETVFLNRPSIKQYSDACDSNSAIFLSAHGRSDTISLCDGKICGANSFDPQVLLDRTAYSDQIVPSCIKTGQCYRPEMTIIPLSKKNQGFYLQMLVNHFLGVMLRLLAQNGLFITL